VFLAPGVAAASDDLAVIVVCGNRSRVNPKPGGIRSLRFWNIPPLKFRGPRLDWPAITPWSLVASPKAPRSVIIWPDVAVVAEAGVTATSPGMPRRALIAV
jgi:hypothetical protein